MATTRLVPFNIVSNNYTIQPFCLQPKQDPKENSLKSLMELFAQLEPNIGGMVTRWVSFRILSDDLTHQQRHQLHQNLV